MISSSPGKLHPMSDGAARIVHRRGPLRSAYLTVARALSAPSGRNVFSGDDLIVANSHWSTLLLDERYGVEAAVLYPPVPGEAAVNGSAQRTGDFVCLGRISPEKRIEDLIGIISRVRARGFDDMRLRVIGGLDGSRYARRIADLARSSGGWVVLEGQLAGEQKQMLLQSCAVAIHGRRAEPFGIAVAEMVRAGCITFVPAEGGPVEIVAHDALTYRNIEEAVEKIVTVLRDEVLQTSLSEHLGHQGAKFSSENFMRGLRAIVDEFLARRAAMPRTRGLAHAAGGI